MRTLLIFAVMVGALVFACGCHRAAGAFAVGAVAGLVVADAVNHAHYNYYNPYYYDYYYPQYAPAPYVDVYYGGPRVVVEGGYYRPSPGVVHYSPRPAPRPTYSPAPAPRSYYSPSGHYGAPAPRGHLSTRWGR